MRWIVDSARKRSEKTMALRLAGEMMLLKAKAALSKNVKMYIEWRKQIEHFHISAVNKITKTSNKKLVFCFNYQILPITSIT